MTCIRCSELLPSLLLLLILNRVCGQEPEVALREEGKNFVMGYCFGSDYIVVYKSVPEGQKLLVNSSNKNLLNTLPEDLRSRFHVNDDQLLGLQISGLKELDSGVYSRECWQNRSKVNENTEQLLVCKEEILSKEITVNEDGGAEIQCNGPSSGQEGTFVRWYHEEYPLYKTTLLVDTSVSIKPLINDLQDSAEVRENGMLLVLDKKALETFPQFYCVVIKGKTCLSFQNMYPPENRESTNKFVSQGDREVLQCPADGEGQLWDTPMGEIKRESNKDDQMYLSASDEPEDFSLIIPAVSEEHSGEYMCVRDSSEIKYSLFVCPKTESLEKFADRGKEVSLECNVEQKNVNSVQWHRLVKDHYELMAEADDESVIISGELKGKVSLSRSGLLTISSVTETDAGKYMCVALSENDSNSEYIYDDKITIEGDSTDYDRFDSSVKCIFRQETVFHIKTKGRMSIPSASSPETTSTPSGTSDVRLYAVLGGLGLALVVAITAAIIVKRKKQTSSTII